MAGGLYKGHAIRLPAGLPGRDLKAAPCRDTVADPDETGASGAPRLRVTSARHRQPLHAVCSARRLAPCQSHRSPPPPWTNAHVLEDLADLHFSKARTIVLVRTISTSTARHRIRGIPGRRSQTAGRALRMALHAKAWQLARSGRVRARRPIPPVSRPPHPDKQILIDEIEAWENDRNANRAKANWHFTTPDARIKLKISTFNLNEIGRLVVRSQRMVPIRCVNRTTCILIWWADSPDAWESSVRIRPLAASALGVGRQSQELERLRQVGRWRRGHPQDCAAAARQRQCCGHADGADAGSGSREARPPRRHTCGHPGSACPGRRNARAAGACVRSAAAARAAPPAARHGRAPGIRHGRLALLVRRHALAGAARPLASAKSMRPLTGLGTPATTAQ